MHLTTPRCSFSTAAIFSTLVFADNLTTVMPFSPDTIGCSFNVHRMLIGKSPLTIIQDTPVLSPVLKDSSPNVNGMICGGTVGCRIWFKKITKRRNGSLSVVWLSGCRIDRVVFGTHFREEEMRNKDEIVCYFSKPLKWLWPRDLPLTRSSDRNSAWPALFSARQR